MFDTERHGPSAPRGPGRFQVGADDPLPAPRRAPSLTLRIPIEGMAVPQCAREVRWAFTQVPGVEEVSVCLASGLATLVVDPQRASPRQLSLAMHASGYRAPLLEQADRLPPRQPTGALR